LDVDEDSINPEDFRAAMRRGFGSVSKPPTTLSYFIHMVSLKRTASDIQHSVYRVDKPADFSDSITEGFLARLNVWKQDIPPEAPLDPARASSSNHFDTPARLHWRGSYVSVLSNEEIPPLEMLLADQTIVGDDSILLVHSASAVSSIDG
jgi:hypothetical protein